MFWRMTGLATASPVDTILDKENFTIEELLDEDEIIQECKALNSRLINFLRDKIQVEQLIRYIVEEAPEGSEKKRSFKFPFIACEIFTCEVDIILNTLLENEELMDLLFSFLKPDRTHSASLAGYFSKVVVCLLLRKRSSLMSYVQTHQPQVIFHQLVDLIGITSIMEVLIRLIGADDHAYSGYSESLPWLDDITVLEMIVDKFSSSDCPEVHANAAETLCTITRFAPRGLIEKISSPSFVARLFQHALEDSRTKSVLVHSLTICISLLDPKRLVSATSYPFRNQLAFGLSVANPETVEGMLGNLGDLLKLLDNPPDSVLLTTYGRLQPPLGKHRLKIVEFISVLLSVGNEVAEKELIRLGGLQQILDLFFKYPFNNFLHHHVENVIISCLESKRTLLSEHLLQECNIVGKLLMAEKNFLLSECPDNPTIPAEGKPSPRIGNIGHITRVANKLIQMGNSSDAIFTYLQGNPDWVDWHTIVLVKRNAMENVSHWACGRPSAFQEEDEDPRDRDYDVAALANNLSRAFHYGIYRNDDNEETNDPNERDDEDYFDDDSAEVVISSLRLGDDQDSSVFTNSSLFGMDEDPVIREHSISLIASSSPNSNDDPSQTASPQLLTEAEPMVEPKLDALINGPIDEIHLTSTSEFEKPSEWVEWREMSGEIPIPNLHQTPTNLNGELENMDHTFEEETSDIPLSPPPANCDTGTSGRESSEASDIPELKANLIPDSSKLPEEVSSDHVHPPGLRDSETTGAK